MHESTWRMTIATDEELIQFWGKRVSQRVKRNIGINVFQSRCLKLFKGKKLS